MDELTRREAMVVAAVGSLALVTDAPADAAPMNNGLSKGRAMNQPDEKNLEEMVARAKKASKDAYCPYSKFRVGAAVMADDGQIFEGCNVENASYGLTICAERNAVFHMVARAKKRIVALVIYTPTQKPSAPCGACRQVINEFGPDALIMSVCDGPGVIRKKLSELLPDAFGPANLDP